MSCIPSFPWTSIQPTNRRPRSTFSSTAARTECAGLAPRRPRPHARLLPIMPRQIPVASRPRALVILEGGSLYPSGVVRALIYREHFARNGWEVVYRNRRFPFLAALVHKPPKF